MTGGTTAQSQKKKTPIIQGLFAWPADEPRLLASRCKECGTVAFPKSPFCTNPDCVKVRENVEEVLLSKRGKVWTFTTQHYPAPLPFRYEPFRPYGIAMIDVPEGLRLLGMLTTTENVKIGSEVEITVGKLYEDKDNEYITYMWKPVG